MDDPHALKSNEMAQASFAPQQPLVCDTFKNCEGLSRVAFMDGNGVVMLGKIVSLVPKGDGKEEAKKKKMDDPHALKSNEMAQASFAPQQPLVCDTFKNC